MSQKHIPPFISFSMHQYLHKVATGKLRVYKTFVGIWDCYQS